MSSDFSKLPEFPKMKVQILKKKELELKITDITKQVNGYKAELRELNAHTRDYWFIWNAAILRFYSFFKIYNLIVNL